MKKILTHKQLQKLFFVILMAILFFLHPIHKEQVFARQGARSAIQEERVSIDGDDVVIIVDEEVPLTNVPMEQEAESFVGVFVIGILIGIGIVSVYTIKKRAKKNHT